MLAWNNVWVAYCTFPTSYPAYTVQETIGKKNTHLPEVIEGSQLTRKYIKVIKVMQGPQYFLGPVFLTPPPLSAELQHLV